jgi:hypothetical protein
VRQFEEETLSNVGVEFSREALDLAKPRPPPQEPNPRAGLRAGLTTFIVGQKSAKLLLKSRRYIQHHTLA